MRLFEIEIAGTTPLICNRFTEAKQQRATGGNSVTHVGDPGTPREQADEKLYRSARDPEKLIIPGPNLFRCIIDAGKYFKAGKSKVTTIKSSIVPACVELVELEVEIQHKDPWEVDSRPVRIPSTGGRILCHRPLFHDWGLHFTIGLDETMMAPKLLRDIIDAAGRRVGLGDFRPDCKGPFGKFVVTKWEELNGDDAKAKEAEATA